MSSDLPSLIPISINSPLPSTTPNNQYNSNSNSNFKFKSKIQI